MVVNIVWFFFLCMVSLSHSFLCSGDSRTTLYGRVSSNNHSRGSSLAEEGYVPMAPVPGDDGYVDMDHGHSGTQQCRHNHGKFVYLLMVYVFN